MEGLLGREDSIGDMGLGESGEPMEDVGHDVGG